MRTDRGRWSRVLGAVVTAVALLAAGAAASGEPGAISYRVTPSAKITKVSYYLDKYKGTETLFFEIAVKNMSDQPKRFRVFVDIPDGPSAAYYYPLAVDEIEAL